MLFLGIKCTMNQLLYTLYITEVDLDKISTAAAAAYPAECCGLLVGAVEMERWLRVTRVIPTRNLWAEERCDRFKIDPVAHLTLMRLLRGGPEYIIGHYHSHPDGQEYPSATDLTMAFEPDLIWVIIAIANSQARAIGAYQLIGATIRVVSVASVTQKSHGSLQGKVVLSQLGLGGHKISLSS